ncbi:MAG: hypothetical protein LUQ44_06470 [Methanothrix sp.]|nr:hypothetical protein [Methanothrix sp.]
MGEIKVDVPEGLPLNDLRKKIIELIKEEEEKLMSFNSSREMNELIDAMEPLQKEQRKKILDKYYGSIKLDRIVSIEEILDLGEDSWRY